MLSPFQFRRACPHASHRQGEEADRLVRLLTEYDYASLLYYGEDGVEVIRRDPTDDDDVRRHLTEVCLSAETPL
jgi:hypothetical protein